MSYSDALQKLETYNDNMNLLHSSTNSTVIDGKKTVRKLVEENVNKTGKLWSSAKEYIIGDIISENSKNYICIDNNINKQPSLNTNFWELYSANIVSGAKGFDKKLTFTKYGDILNGEEYFSISNIGNGAFRCTFKNPEPDTDYAIFMTVESQTLEKFAKLITDITVDFFDIKTYSYTDLTYKDADIYNILIMRKN